MALNIPFNLMSASAPPPAAQASGNAAAGEAAPPNAVQPSPSASGSSNTAANDNSGGRPSTEQQAATTRRPAQQPARAEPNSVLVAQAEPAASDSDLATARKSAERAQDAARTKALIESVAATPAGTNGLLDRPQQVDRYAPPDPLPTAPILKKSGPAAAPVKPSAA